MKALCAGKPADWWDTGDGGNRLAIMFCRVCPRAVRCPLEVPQPHGVIVAGVAYTDAGVPLPECACGYPVVGYRGGPVHRCMWCTGRKPQASTEAARPDAGPDEALVQRLMRGAPAPSARFVDRREAFRRLDAQGLTAPEMARLLGVQPAAIHAARRRARKKAAA